MLVTAFQRQRRKNRDVHLSASDFRQNMKQDHPRFCLLGAAPDTGNLGVSALFHSIVNSIFDRWPDANLTVFDHGRGLREGAVEVGDRTYGIRRVGANLSRRYYRSDNLLNMRVHATLGINNPGVSALREADAVLDISGGDSFADLYGPRRFRLMTQPKLMTLEAGSKLTLLPQTYGPFSSPASERIARKIVRGAHVAWARDGRNFETLKQLLGDDFDPVRHRQGLDVAFALPASRPDRLAPGLERWIVVDRPELLVGVNVSGLIHNPENGSRGFGFKADYREIIHCLLVRLLEQTSAHIVLVPHVLAGPGNPEDDRFACLKAASALGGSDRVQVLDERYNAMEMKWLIGQFDFFCGTRMHSTIAGLSSGVPTAAVAYSKKTLGVFETCGQGEAVADPRSQSTSDAIATIWRTLESRDAVRSALAAAIPDIKRMAEEQMDAILEG